ncbi:MAG: peptidylprolyl isomerase [Abditibacteriota bacterium]|nr:peptidylprolyl isomerase [Abditibacteriota bacterium]
MSEKTKKTIINIIIVLVVIGVIVGINKMMQSNEYVSIHHEDEEEHDHGGGPKSLDATLQMGKVCVINTEKGSFDIVLLQRDIRNSTSIFLNLAKSGKYDDVKFNKVNSWMILSDFPKKEIAPFEQEQAYGLLACRGAVCLARGNKSHEMVPCFAVIKETSPSVGEQFTIFGYVVKGMDIVDKITEDDVIKNITTRKATDEDEQTLISLIKEGHEDAQAIQKAQAKSQKVKMDIELEKARKSGNLDKLPKGMIQ